MILAQVSNEIRNRDMDERNRGDTLMSPQLFTRNADADMSKHESEGLKDCTVVSEWAQQAYEMRGNLVGEDPTYEGCDDFLLYAVI